MIQQSQGPVADRTAETLTATDVAIVRFRRLLLGAAEALARDGEEPSAPRNHEAYRTRPGAWVAAREKELEDVLLERFGHPRGRVPE